MRERIKHQIEYDWLRGQFRQEQVDELLEIMLEVAMNRSETIRIGRDAEYPTQYVQERFQKITSAHIERVLEGIADNRTQVRNTKGLPRFTTYFCTQKNRRTGFPIRRQTVYLPNKSLCVPVRASVSTRISSSMR